MAEPSTPSVAAVVQFVGKLGEFNAPSADAFSPAEEEVARAFCAGVGALWSRRGLLTHPFAQTPS